MLGKTSEEELDTILSGAARRHEIDDPLELVAQSVVDEAYRRFQSSLVMCRAYVTVSLGALPKANADWVRDLVEAKGVSAELTERTPVISLVGSAGRLPEWNDRRRSAGHKGIPMVSASFIDAIPMMSRLMASLGGDLDWIDDSEGDAVISRLGTVAGTFYVGDATSDVDGRGRLIISASDFVARHGVRTVFGVGGAFASGQILVLLFFCSESIDFEVVERFRAPFLALKSNLAGHLRRVFVDGGANEGSRTPDSHRSRPAMLTNGELAELVGKRLGDLDTLNRLYLDLESKLEQKTHDLRLILDNAGDAFAVVDLTGTLRGEATRQAVAWFGAHRPGQPLWSWLFQGTSHEAANAELGFFQLAEGILPFEHVVEQMPCRFARDGRSFEIGYHPIRERGEIGRVLVVVRDVTAREAARRAEARSRELHAVMTNAVQDLAAFRRFANEVGALVAAIARSDSGAAKLDHVTYLRTLHTLKGNAAMFGFATFSNEVHEVENVVLAGEETPADHGRALTAAWEDAIAPLASLVDGAQLAHVDLTPDEHRRFLAGLAGTTPREELLAIANSWTDERAARPLDRLARHARHLAVRLGRSLSVSCEGGSLRLPVAPLEAFWASAVHLVRNAVDHGIEDEDERARAGKPAIATVRFQCAREGTELVVTVEDDGRGIDWDAVRAKAAARGLPSSSVEDLQAALFADGISTRAEASALSGRGVGLAAVLAACRELGGAIAVRSTPGSGTAFVVRVPLWASSAVVRAA